MGAVRVRRVPSGREEVVKFDGEKLKVGDLLELMGLKRESVIVTRGGKIVPEEESVGDGEELVIYDVVSGG